MTDNALVSSTRAHTDNITSMSGGNMKLIYTWPGIVCAVSVSYGMIDAKNII